MHCAQLSLWLLNGSEMTVSNPRCTLSGTGTGRVPCGRGDPGRPPGCWCGPAALWSWSWWSCAQGVAAWWPQTTAEREDLTRPWAENGSETGARSPAAHRGTVRDRKTSLTPSSGQLQYDLCTFTELYPYRYSEGLIFIVGDLQGWGVAHGWLHELSSYWGEMRVLQRNSRK